MKLSRRPRGNAATPSRAVDVPTSASTRLSDLSIRMLWDFFKRQGAAYWLLCFYFFLEYVRPQSIWPALDVLPWAQTTLIVCALALFVERLGRLRFAVPLVGALAFYSVVLVVSSLNAYQPGIAIDGWRIFFTWVLVFFLTVNLVDTEERFFVFMLLFLLWNLKMSQHATRSWAQTGFAFRDWGVTGAPGWFHNSGEYGIQMTMFFPLSVYFIRTFWDRWGTVQRVLMGAMPITAVIGIVGSSSRGALLGLAVVVLVMLFQSRKLKAALGAGILALCVFLMLPAEQQERLESMGEDRTSQARLTYWADGIEITNRHPLLGIGYENWLPYYQREYGGPQLPHSIVIEAGAELGYAGLFAFGLLLLSSFRVNWKTRRVSARMNGDRAAFLKNMAYGLDAALVGFLVSGMFVTVLYYPYLWVNLATTGALYVAARVEAARARPEPAAAARASRTRVGRPPNRVISRGTGGR